MLLCLNETYLGDAPPVSKANGLYVALILEFSHNSGKKPIRFLWKISLDSVSISENITGGLKSGEVVDCGE